MYIMLIIYLCTNLGVIFYWDEYFFTQFCGLIKLAIKNISRSTELMWWSRIRWGLRACNRGELANSR